MLVFMCFIPFRFGCDEEQRYLLHSANASNAGNRRVLSAREKFNRDGIFIEKVTLICQAAGSGDWFSLEPVSSPVAVKLTVTAQH